MFFSRALSSASAKTVTTGSSARNSMPATVDPVATTAPAPTSDREAKDATSPAAAPQVCVSLNQDLYKSVRDLPRCLSSTCWVSSADFKTESFPFL